ncbi:MAG: hypothetical protein U5L72_16090 [Bacteroidales bacterium]|nr:hypothetical protein [Bacteroidales bacterium]
MHSCLMMLMKPSFTCRRGQPRQAAINLWAAKALRARLLIYKASKFNDAASYTAAAAQAEEVITGSGASFFNSYADCWLGANEDGTNNREVIWHVDYSTRAGIQYHARQAQT